MTITRRGTVAMVALLTMAAAGRSARARDLMVSPTGDDAASGAAGAPWRTLQAAADKVQAGDTVTVADGTYAGFACQDKKGTATARITFRAQNIGGAHVTSAGAGANAQDWIQLSGCSYVTVDGFEVSGAPRSGIAILGNTDTGEDARDVIIQNNHSHHNGGTAASGRHDGIFSGFALNLTIQDNEVHDSGEHGIYVSNAADNPIIRRNHVHDVGANCIQINADLSTGGDGLISNWAITENVISGCRGAAGVNLDGAIMGLLANNLIFDCAKGGITLFQGDGAAASHDNVVVNNTVYNPDGSRSALQVADGANNNVVFNNILYSKAAGLEVQTVTGLVHDYNFISTYDGGAASAHEMAPAAASLFVDLTGRDLHLGAASPALDSGVATLGGHAAPTTDREGRPRPQGAGFDRGCYEVGTGGPPPGDASAPRDGSTLRDAAVPRDGGSAPETAGAKDSGLAEEHPASAGADAQGGAPGGGSDAGTDAPRAATDAPGVHHSSSSGCGCALEQRAPGWPAALLGLLLAIAHGRRRRRHR